MQLQRAMTILTLQPGEERAAPAFGVILDGGVEIWVRGAVRGGRHAIGSSQ